jgi:hypothetical protein
VGEGGERLRRLELEAERRPESHHPAGILEEGPLSELDHGVGVGQTRGPVEGSAVGPRGHRHAGGEVEVTLAAREETELFLHEVVEDLAPHVHDGTLGVEGAQPAHHLGGLEVDLAHETGDLRARELAMLHLADHGMVGQPAARLLQSFFELLHQRLRRRLHAFLLSKSCRGIMTQGLTAFHRTLYFGHSRRERAMSADA